MTVPPAPSAAPTIVAFSYGGFHAERDGLMDHYLFALTGKSYPRVCLLGTTAGDSETETVKFMRAFMGRAELTYAPAYRHLLPGDDPIARLLEADSSTSRAATRRARWRRGRRSAGTTFCAAHGCRAR